MAAPDVEPGGDRRAFVLHEHRRPRPHFDLRIEQDGVLRSWALPRGLPGDSSQNRLAIAVPDHDMEHLTYVDADKSIADTGWWEEEDSTERRILLILHGRTGARRYALIHTGGDGSSGSADGGQDTWLMRLTKDQPG